MRLSGISFVVIDARRRIERCKELLAQGVPDLLQHLKTTPQDYDTVRNGAVILDLNEAAVQLFGGSDKSAFIGQPTRQFFAPDCPALANVADAYFQGQTEIHQPAKTLRLDGTPFDSLFCIVMKMPGAQDGIWLAGFIDTSEEVRQRAMSEALRDELAHVSRISVLGEMSASIAHELGQPLGSISMYTQAALNRLQGPQPDLEAVRKACERIALQVTRATEIIGRVRGMAARRPGTASTVPVGSLIREAVRFVGHELERSSVALSYGIEEGNFDVFVDRIQIQQLLVNLLMNAIQVMREAGSPSPTICVGGKRVGDALVLEVRDNGPGIPEEALPHLFASFFSSRPDGLGLGLSICRTIVESHGGTITAANRTDRCGAVFTITMPLGDPPQS